MSAWDDLVSACLLGAERRTVSGLDAAVVAILAVPVEAASPEEELLVAAGVLGSWRRAGWIPSHTHAAPAPAPPDPRPDPPAAATQLLELLLDGHVSVIGDQQDLVGAWLSRCAATGRRVPPRLMPRVLETATAGPGLRGPAVAAGGEPLRWLAARNPAWAWATPAPTPDPTAADPADTEALWATGGRDARLELLTTLRRRDPARARALLEGTWKGEPAADRIRWLEVLATGLGDDDEPFLEAALDDRSKGVRAAAAALLARLPSSRLAARMADRLRPLVRTTGRLRTRIHAALPDDLDAGAARDGITDQGAPPQTGRRAWLLIQVITATPLAFWEEHTGVPPQRIVDQHGGQRELLDGWVRAAAHQRDATWARHLLEQRPEPTLLASLPPADAHATLVTVLGRVDDAALPGLLSATAGPWPLAASRAVLARLRAGKSHAAVAPALSVLAANLDAQVADDVDGWARSLPADSTTRHYLGQLLRTLSIRQSIDQELS